MSRPIHDRRWSPTAPYYGEYPGFHFNVDVEPSWTAIRPLVEARARSLGYPIRDAADLRPRFRAIRFTGTRWMEFVDGGLRFDVLGVLNVDEPLGYHVLHAGQTQQFRAHFGLFDRAFARTRLPSRDRTAESELAMDLTDEALGFDLHTDRPATIAQFPTFSALHTMWAAAAGRAPLRVLREDGGVAKYLPMSWAPDFRVREWDGGAALRFEGRELSVTIELTPMRAGPQARAHYAVDPSAALAETQDEAEAISLDADADEIPIADDDVDSSAEATSEIGPSMIAKAARLAERLPSYPIADEEPSCPSCGGANEPSARFCAACGVKLG